MRRADRGEPARNGAVRVRRHRSTRIAAQARTVPKRRSAPDGRRCRLEASQPGPRPVQSIAAPRRAREEPAHRRRAHRGAHHYSWAATLRHDQAASHDRRRPAHAEAPALETPLSSACTGARPRVRRGKSHRGDRGFVEAIRQHNPALYAAHPMLALEPDEEYFAMEISFLAHINTSSFHTPSYEAWLTPRTSTTGTCGSRNCCSTRSTRKVRREIPGC